MRAVLPSLLLLTAPDPPLPAGPPSSSVFAAASLTDALQRDRRRL